MCETHFCCTSRAAARPSPRAVGGGQPHPPPAAPLQMRGIPRLGHKAGLDRVLSVSCCRPACLLPRRIAECSSWVK